MAEQEKKQTLEEQINNELSGDLQKNALDFITYMKNTLDFKVPFVGFTQIWTVMRHKTNTKSFALIYERHDKLRINLKCDPIEAEFLRQAYKDVTPGWHMNKEHWNTITLDGDVPEDELKLMIERSYNLIKPKKRRPNNAD